MAQSKVELFARMASEQPDNEMIWYGLANEYVKLERWSEAAEALGRVIQINPDYTAAYQLHGTALANLGDHGEARRVWRDGVAVAKRTGAWKAQQHMEGLLANTETEVNLPGLCAE